MYNFFWRGVTGEEQKDQQQTNFTIVNYRVQTVGVVVEFKCSQCY